MTPKEKAQELVNRMTRPTPKNEDFNLYDDYYNDFNNYGKQCALIAIDEIINLLGPSRFLSPELTLGYWLKVKQEIESL